MLLPSTVDPGSLPRGMEYGESAIIGRSSYNYYQLDVPDTRDSRGEYHAVGLDTAGFQFDVRPAMLWSFSS